MCSVIDRVESYGITRADLEHVLKKRSGDPQGKLSAHSITLVVLGAVEDEWKQRQAGEGSG